MSDNFDQWEAPKTLNGFLSKLGVALLVMGLLSLFVPQVRMLGYQSLIIVGTNDLRHWSIKRLATYGEAAIVPLSLALKEDDEAVRMRAVIGLERVLKTASASGAEQAVSVLMKGLTNPSAGARASYCRGLGLAAARSESVTPGSTVTRSAVALLVSTLQDNEEVVRAGAMGALGKIGHTAGPSMARDITHVLAAYFAEDFVHPDAGGALQEMGSAAISPLLGLLENGEAKLKPGVVCHLGFIAKAHPAATTEELVSALANCLGDKSLSVRRLAPSALGGAGPKAIPQLVKALEHENPTVRSGAVSAFYDLTRPPRQAMQQHVVPALMLALEDKDTQVRLSAVRALGKWSDYSNPHVDPDLAAHTALRAAPALAKLFKDTDRRVSVEAAFTLARNIKKDGAPISILLQALEESNAQSRERAAMALGLLGPKAAESLPLLIKALQDREAGVRSEAAETLGAIGRAAAKALPALEKSLQDPDPTVRDAANKALEEIRQK